jgi:redox-sensitive bicupin YhaK (pirin superfamily)
VARLIDEFPAGAVRWIEALRRCPPADIPAVIFSDAEVRVLAGRYHGLLGPLADEPLAAVVRLGGEGEVSLPAPGHLPAIVCALDAPVAVGQVLVNPGQAAMLDVDGDGVTVTAGALPASALIITGPGTDLI